MGLEKWIFSSSQNNFYSVQIGLQIQFQMSNASKGHACELNAIGTEAPNRPQCHPMKKFNRLPRPIFLLFHSMFHFFLIKKNNKLL